MERRLTAILAADVAGYSRLMGVSEVATLAALKAHRAEMIDAKIAEHLGRIVKLTGDGMLVEFPSVVNAVACAAGIQREMRTRNAEIPQDRRIEFRIGINLGDVIAEDGDIYGDGVNIAARIESIAQPGGVAVSASVRDHVGNKLDLAFEDMGEQSLKNIEQPVRVYNVLLDAVPPGAGTLVGLNEQRPRAGWVDPDKRSVAVLPFANMSGDAEQEYFADGLTEDVITELSRFKSLFVIARNSSFHFKGRNVKVQDVGAELAVQYVVEGSVRKVGSRVRVTAQLVETANGSHLWAERYDRELDDIFAVQDELVRAIASAIPGEVSRQALEQARRKPPENHSAYECELRGRWAFLHWSEGLAAAISWYEKAVAADPDYARARAGLASVYAYSVYALGEDPAVRFPMARDHAAKAIAGGDRDPSVQRGVANVYHLTGERDLALHHAERAVALNPNDPMVLHTMGDALSYNGRMTEALEWYAKSRIIEPYAPDDQRLDNIEDTYYMLGQYEEVVRIQSVYQNVPAFLYVVYAAALAQLGRMEESQAAMRQFYQKRLPGQDPVLMCKTQIAMCSRPEDRERWREGYGKLGLL